MEKNKKMFEMKGFLREAVLQTGAGGTAGFVEVCAMHPLDLVKTRLQLQKKNTAASRNDPKYYFGVWDCFTKMVKHEGKFSLWKGILPPILAESLRRAFKFFTFEQYKKIFMFGSTEPTALTFGLAGFAAGASEAILINPFEVVKVTLQANMAKAGNVPSTWFVTKLIAKTDGFGSNGLYKGVTAFMARNGTFTMVSFGFYYSMIRYLPKYQDPTLELLRKIGIGFVSGTLASCCNCPFDVVKSRIQGPQPTPGKVKYRGTIRVIRMVYREEGYLALYKGLLPKVMRLGPGGAIILVVYDYLYGYLSEVFPDD